MSIFNITATVRDVTVPHPPREVTVTMPYSVAQSVMVHLAKLPGDAVSAWALFAALQGAG